MSYAVIARFALPKALGSAYVGELVLSRHNLYDAAKEKLVQVEAGTSKTIVPTLLAGWKDLQMDGIAVTYGLRAE